MVLMAFCAEYTVKLESKYSLDVQCERNTGFKRDSNIYGIKPLSETDRGSEVDTQICSVVHYCSVSKSCLTLCNPVDCSTPDSVSPRVCSDSCPLSWWCYLTIFPSAAPFSFCLQSFPASGSFPMSLLFTSGGQSIGALASTSVLPMNIVYHI